MRRVDRATANIGKEMEGHYPWSATGPREDSEGKTDWERGREEKGGKQTLPLPGELC